MICSESRFADCRVGETHRDRGWTTGGFHPPYKIALRAFRSRLSFDEQEFARVEQHLTELDEGLMSGGGPDHARFDEEPFIATQQLATGLDFIGGRSSYERQPECQLDHPLGRSGE
jgi:hypothetical protein